MSGSDEPEFNPYRDWLGIPISELPADHYQLLGVERYEADPDRLQAAADQRMKTLRNFRVGRFADVSETLLNEIARAKICLLDPARRVEYEQELKSERRGLALRPLPESDELVPAHEIPDQAAAHLFSELASDPDEWLTPNDGEAGRTTVRGWIASRTPDSLTWVLPSIVGLLAVVALVMALGWYLLNG